MSDMRQSAPPPAPKSNGSIIFIVGGLVVAVGVLAYVFVGAPKLGSGASTPAISIENNATAPAAEPAPTPEPAPAAPAPAAPAPAPAAPAQP